MKMGKGKKNCYIILFVCGLLVSGFFMLKTIFDKKTIEKEITNYEYQISKNINYKVYMKDNVIYDEEYLEEGLYYPRKLIDYIRIDYDLEYTGTQKVPISIDYQCFAKIESYIGQQDTRETYWIKAFPLQDKQSISAIDNILKINEKFDVELDDYINFVNEVTQVLGAILDYDIFFSMEGIIIAQTPYGKVEQPFSFDIASSFSNNLKFSKNSLDTIIDSITEKLYEQAAPDISVIVLYSGLAIVCLIAILYLLIFAQDYDLNDLVINTIRKIHKEYGSRIVFLNSNSDKSYSRLYDVYSIKDLVKVADELQKPILYERDDKELVKDFKFFVQNGDELYEYCVLNSIVEEYKVQCQ